MKHQDISSIKTDFIIKLLLKFGGYFDGQIRRFQLNSSNDIVVSNELAHDFQPKILIVSRRLYQEKITNYPIESKKELHKLLRLAREQTPQLFHALIKTDEATSTVNSWQFNKNVPNVLLTLPESLLLGLANPKHQVVCLQSPANVTNSYNNEELLYVLNNHGATYSQVKGGNISNANLFALSTGVQLRLPEQKFPLSVFAQQLVQGLSLAPITLLSPFLRIKQSMNKTVLLKNTLLPFSVVMLSYLLLSSGYLLYKNNQLDNALATQSNSVNSALLKQQRFDKSVAELNELDAFLANKKNHGNFWLVLADTFNQATITQVKVNNYRYQIRGKATKALTLLELLANHPLVKEASFANPTKKSRSGEIFVISLLLHDTTASNTTANINQEGANNE